MIATNVAAIEAVAVISSNVCTSTRPTVGQSEVPQAGSVRQRVAQQRVRLVADDLHEPGQQEQRELDVPTERDAGQCSQGWGTAPTLPQHR